MIKIEEKLVPVPVVVVKEVEVTKLVPFEPTPPGFGPIDGWSEGMPIDHTNLLTPPPKTTLKKYVWTRPQRRKTTTSTTTVITTTLNFSMPNRFYYNRVFESYLQRLKTIR